MTEEILCTDNCPLDTKSCGESQPKGVRCRCIDKEKKKLEEYYRELIDDIFRSFSEEHRKHLNLMFREKTVEWLTQNNNDVWAKRKIDELLEDANAPPRKKNK